MREHSYFLGVDVSTTGTKVLIIDQIGSVVASATCPLFLRTPRPLWVEQSPQDWWKGVVSSIREVLAITGINSSNILAVGLTGQMHGLVLLDERGEVLRPAILWNDQRTEAQCEEIRRRLGKERLINITGNDALPGFTAPKILWVQQNEPDIYSKVQHILLPKDYIRYKMTKEYATDRAGGSGTILFELKKRSWSEEVLGALDIQKHWMPPTFEGTEVTGYISCQAAQETGLSEHTPVVAGGGDQAAQAVGVGAVEPGIIAVTIGTSGVVFASTNRPIIQPEGRLHAFCHAVPNRWILMGVMLSAAGSLQWFRDSVAPGIGFETLISEAEEIQPGSDGLLFLPYLMGERTPYPDPLARGAWIGLTLRHRRAHMTRALLEGVAFGIKDSFTLIENAGLGEIHQVRISGGGAKSPLWQRILADVLGLELVMVNTTEGAAFGAALLAGVGAGLFSSIEDACKTVIIAAQCQESTGMHPLYQDYYPHYQALYSALKGEFQGINEVVNRWCPS